MGFIFSGQQFVYYGFSFTERFWRDFQDLEQLAEFFIRLCAFSDGYGFIKGILSAGG